MKTFILLSAIPGSGKSAWSEQYRLTHENVFIVSSDALRKEIGGACNNLNHEQEVWDRFLLDIKKIRDTHEDVTIIGDSTNIYNKFRKFYAENLDGFDKKILVIIRKDLETVLRQNRVRNPEKIVPEEAIKKMWGEWEDPDNEVKALYDQVVVVDKWFETPDVKREFYFK